MQDETKATDTRIHTISSIIFRAVVLGTGVFLIAVGAQWIVYERILMQPGVMRLLSPLIAAISTGLFSAQLQIQQRSDRLAMLKRYELVKEMNHHIRNALQVIAYYGSGPQFGEGTVGLREAVDRIEWTLREVLPSFNPETSHPGRADGVRPTAGRGPGR